MNEAQMRMVAIHTIDTLGGYAKPYEDEGGYDDHSYHDEPLMHTADCCHCAVYVRFWRERPMTEGPRWLPNTEVLVELASELVYRHRISQGRDGHPTLSDRELDDPVLTAAGRDVQ